LGVRAVLTGRVSQRENYLTIQVDLVSVAEGSQLWGAQYNRKPAEIQSVQEDIVRDLSQRLHLNLNREQEQRLVKRDTKNTEAYDLYLKGRYHLEKRTEDGIKKAIDFFQQATGKDSEFALAYAGLADCYILGGNALPWPETEVRLKAKEAALEALAKDDTLAEAHTSLAVVSMLYDWNWSTAEREFKRAIELNPSYVTAHHWYAEYLAAMGRHDQAFNEITRAQKLDPLSVIISRDVGMHHYYAGRYDQAIDQARDTLALDSGFSQAHRLLGLAYLKKGQIAEAIAELQDVAAATSSGRDRAMLAQAYAIGGRHAEVRRLLNELLSEGSVSPYYIAVIHAGLGDRQRAFDSLERAYREQVSSLVYLNVDPRLESLRPDPRFRDLAKRVGLPE
jgi:tetratricopeptide (TPR) repeat protein